MYLLESDAAAFIDSYFYLKHGSPLLKVLSSEFTEVFVRKDRKYRIRRIYHYLGLLVIKKGLCAYEGTPFINLEGELKDICHSYSVVPIPYLGQCVKTQLVHAGKENRDPNIGEKTQGYYHLGPELPVNPLYQARLLEGYSLIQWAETFHYPPRRLTYLLGWKNRRCSSIELESILWDRCKAWKIEGSKDIIDLRSSLLDGLDDFIGFPFVDLYDLCPLFRFAFYTYCNDAAQAQS